MVIFPMTLTDPNPVLKVTSFLKSNIGKRRVLKTNVLFHTNRKLYLTYGMVLCLVCLADLKPPSACLSASAELLVYSCIAPTILFDTLHIPENQHDNPTYKFGKFFSHLHHYFPLHM